MRSPVPEKRLPVGLSLLIILVLSGVCWFIFAEAGMGLWKLMVQGAS